jgi:hypothetical protein
MKEDPVKINLAVIFGLLGLLCLSGSKDDFGWVAAGGMCWAFVFGLLWRGSNEKK